jgi:hypothetical protein
MRQIGRCQSKPVVAQPSGKEQTDGSDFKHQMQPVKNMANHTSNPDVLSARATGVKREGPDFKAQVNPRSPEGDVEEGQPLGDSSSRVDGPAFPQQVQSVGTMQRAASESEATEETCNNDVGRQNNVAPGAVPVYPDGRRPMEEPVMQNSTDAEARTVAREPEREDTVLPVAYPVTSETVNHDNQSNDTTLLLLSSCLCVLVLIGAVLGGVCGSGLCTKYSSGEATIPPPSSSGNETHFRSFNSTEELYQAVDVYLLGLTENPKESIAARTYGYPIGTWDVSRIKNFSFVFAPIRNSTYDLLRPSSKINPIPECPVNVSTPEEVEELEACLANYSWLEFFSDFNEDISRWNVSSAETMQAMFTGCHLCV